MAFPKTQTASCLLTQAPAAVSERQLRELSIRLRKPQGERQSRVRPVLAPESVR